MTRDEWLLAGSYSFPLKKWHVVFFFLSPGDLRDNSSFNVFNLIPGKNVKLMHKSTMVKHFLVPYRGTFLFIFKEIFLTSRLSLFIRGGELQNTSFRNIQEKKNTLDLKKGNRKGKRAMTIKQSHNEADHELCLKLVVESTIIQVVLVNIRPDGCRDQRRGRITVVELLTNG